VRRRKKSERRRWKGQGSRTRRCEVCLLLLQLTFSSDILSLYFSLFQTLRGVCLDFWLTDLISFLFTVRLMVSDSGISLRVSLEEKKKKKIRI
jgi:hypothetical protein